MSENYSQSSFSAASHVQASAGKIFAAQLPEAVTYVLSQTPLYFLTGIYALGLCTLGVNPSYGSVEDILKSYSTSAGTFPA